MQFNRQAELRITALNGSTETTTIVRGVRMTFEVEKSLLPNAYNHATIEVYNLSEATRNSISDKGQRIELSVDYVDDNPDKPLRRIAQGDIMLYRHEHNPPEIVTRIEIVDGLTVGKKPIGYSGKEGLTYKKALEDMARKIGLNADFKKLDYTTLANKVMQAGYSFAGLVEEAFSSLTDTIDVDWFIEDNTVYFVPKDSYHPDEIFLISPDTGMIGSPKKVDDVTSRSGNQKKKAKKAGGKAVNVGYDVECLLNPLLFAGDLVHVSSPVTGLEADLKIERILHRGDTHGNDWTSQIRAVKV